MWINGKEVVDNGGQHGIKTKDGSVELKAGIHPLQVIWFNADGGGWLDVYYRRASKPKEILPVQMLR